MRNTEDLLGILKEVVAIAKNRMPKKPTLPEIEILTDANYTTKNATTS